MTGNWLLIVDVTPLWELHFSGISNVVYELTRRLRSEISTFEIHFSVFQKMVETDVVDRCILERSGRALRELFNDASPLISASEFGRNRAGQVAALYLHTRPETRSFDFEAQLYYDFSFLSVPESLSEEIIKYHLDGVSSQVHCNDIIFTISQSTSNDLWFYFDYPANKTEIALLGCQVSTQECVSFSRRVGERSIEPYFICIGTIEPRKNIRLILAWLAENPWVLGEFRFLFVGQNGWGESFDELIAEADLEFAVRAGRIVHTGYVTEAQKTALLLGAQGLIYASLFEGFGLPVLEAMALGVPIAASCSTSIPEVLGPDGVYFDPYSVASFDGAMQTLLAEREKSDTGGRRRKLANRARTFSYDKCYAVIMSRLAAEAS